MFRSIRLIVNHLNKFNIIQSFPTTVRSCAQLASLEDSTLKFPKPDSKNFNLKNDYINTFTERSHHCGQLRLNHVGQQVRLIGWLQQQRMGRFLVLRDSYGQVQLQVSDKLSKQLRSSRNDVRKIPLESVLQVEGEVLARPADQINSKMATGKVEVMLQSLQVLSRCRTTLPFTVRDAPKVSESLRMKHRYLELRSDHLQKALRLRSDFLNNVRQLLIKQLGFVEIETPTLFKRTPGGAQEFCVPTRHRHRYYSLVQSPQQFKQMLMVGSMDRYFQIARCYRDETSRADRQPEFTQIDLELSFTNPYQIQLLVERILVDCWPSSLPSICAPFTRITFDEAMRDYGTDQPDVRLQMKMSALSPRSFDRGHVFKFEVNGFAKCRSKELEKLKELSSRMLRQFNLENKAQLQLYLSMGNDQPLIRLDPENLAGFDVNEIEENEAEILKHLKQKPMNDVLHCFVVGRNAKAVSINQYWHF